MKRIEAIGVDGEDVFLFHPVHGGIPHIQALASWMGCGRSVGHITQLIGQGHWDAGIGCAVDMMAPPLGFEVP